MHSHVGATSLLAPPPKIIFQALRWMDMSSASGLPLYVSSFTFFHSSGTCSLSILGIVTNCDLSEWTLALKSSPLRLIMSSLLQSWGPCRHSGSPCMEAQQSWCKTQRVERKEKPAEWRVSGCVPMGNGKWGLQSLTQGFLLNITRLSLLVWMPLNYKYGEALTCKNCVSVMHRLFHPYCRLYRCLLIQAHDLRIKDRITSVR